VTVGLDDVSGVALAADDGESNPVAPASAADERLATADQPTTQISLVVTA
jgi:hypothetical protein